MKILGIPLRKPAFSELTAAAVMACGLWVMAVGLCFLGGVDLDAVDAGALLVVIAWGAASARFGIRVDQGQRHLAANTLVCAVLLLGYQGAVTLVA